MEIKYIGFKIDGIVWKFVPSRWRTLRLIALK